MDYQELSETIKDVMNTSLGLNQGEDLLKNMKPLDIISEDEAEVKDGIYPKSVEISSDVVDDDRDQDLLRMVLRYQKRR